MTRTTRVLLLIAAALIPFVFVEHAHHARVMHQFGMHTVEWVHSLDQSLCGWSYANRGCTTNI